MAEFTGFNAEQVTSLGATVKSTAESVVSEIGDILQTGVIDPMSKAWYAKEGKDFFDGFITAVKETRDTIQEAFDTYKGALEQAGSEWSDKTHGGEGKGEAVTLESFTVSDFNLNNSLEESNAGNEGINEGDAKAVAQRLNAVRDEIEEKLKALAANMNAEAAFLGHGQADAVSECFEKIVTSIRMIFKSLTEGEDSLQSCIDKYVKSYESFAQSVTQGFSASGN